MADENFDLQKHIENLSEEIVSDIFSKRKKENVKKEYIDHIEDNVFNNLLLGMNELEAFQLARESLGDIEKIKFLLSETHNNNFQIFLIDKIFSKIRAIFNRKKTYLVIMVTLISILVLAILAMAYPLWAEYIFIKIITLPYGFVTNPEVRKRIISFVVFAIVFFVAIALIKTLLSCILYFVVRVKSYFDIFIFCISHKCKFRICRFPFSSLFRMNADGDIIIMSSKRTFRIHFMDVVLRYRREVIIIDNNQYIVSKSLPDKLKTYGGTLIDGQSWFNMYATVNSGYVWNGHKVKDFPNVQSKDDSLHILVIQQKPLAQTFIRKNHKISIYDGDVVNGCEYRSLKSLLKFIARGT